MIDSSKRKQFMHVKNLSMVALLLSCPSLALAQTAPAQAPVAPATAAPQSETVARPVKEAEPSAAPQTEDKPVTVVEPKNAAPPPETERKEETLGKSLQVSKEGLFQPGALIQAWFFMNHQDHTSSTFRLRRAELTAKGEILPKTVAYRITLDVAKLFKFGSSTSVPVTDTVSGDDVTPAEEVAVPTAPADGSIMQDVYITWITDYADTSIGQFKIPVSWEGYNSSSKLLFPERALVSTQFGDKRDIGLRVEKKFKHVGYTAGVYNGAGQGHLDENNQKDVALRLEGYPIDGVMIGAVGYTSIGGRKLAGKDRLEGDLRAQLGDALLQAEYIHGWDRPKGGRTEGHGVYGALGYMIGHLQPVARVGLLDKNVDTADTAGTDKDDTTNSYELGANYYIVDHDLKLQANFGVFNPHQSGAKNITAATFAAQLGF
jgi:hypothetical protein